MPPCLKFREEGVHEARGYSADVLFSERNLQKRCGSEAVVTSLVGQFSAMPNKHR
jgi:hypothetical protein